MHFDRPAIGTLTRAGTAVAAGAVAWVTVLTTLDSDMFAGVAPDRGARVILTAAAAVGVGAATWLLSGARTGQARRRDAAFAEVLGDGNELVWRCLSPRPEDHAREDWFQTLLAAWKDWDNRAWELVRVWGTPAMVEIYSRENPTAGRTRQEVAANVQARLDRLERFLEAR